MKCPRCQHENRLQARSGIVLLPETLMRRWMREIAGGVNQPAPPRSEVPS